MSNYPHSSSFAASLSTSPYAIQNNLEALMRRSRSHPHAHPHAHRRTSGPISPLSQGQDSERSSISKIDALGGGGRDSFSSTQAQDGGDSEVTLMFAHEEETRPPAPPTRGPAHDEERGRRGSDGRHARAPKRYSYGAVSEPLAHNTTPVAIDSSAPAGNSRSRSKGRTPPRVVRPFTRKHREAATAAGASLGALGSVASDADGEADADAGSSAISTASEYTAASPSSPFRSLRRGRSQDRRPISPAVLSSMLPPTSSDEEEDDDESDAEGEAAKAHARANLWQPGASSIGEPLLCDPAEELDAEDLDLPTDAAGREVHTWRGAMAVELPLLLRTTIPVFFTQLAEYSLALASVISIGHLGTKDLAASSLANMTAAVSCYSIVQGIATALDTLLPAAWTSSDPSRVGLWTQRMFVVMSFAMIPMFVFWFNIEAILNVLGQDPDVARLAGVYLAYLSPGIPGYAGNVILKKYLQAQNIMDVPTYILFIVAPLNLVLNWVLVWGPPAVRLGFKGGAIATAFSYNLTFVLLLGYILWLGPRTAWHPLTAKGCCSKLGTLASLGVAGTVMTSSEWWAWEVCALAASFLGPTTLAAQSVLLSTCSTLYQFPASLGVASAVRVGNLLGAGRGWEAKWASRASFVWATVFALGNSAVCVVFRHRWGYIFNSDPVVVGLVAQVLPWIGLFQVMDGLSGAANAVLRAQGLHATGALINLTSYYVIGIPFGLWLMFSKSVGLGLVGIWIGLTLSLTYASTVGIYIVWNADWDRSVERVRDRLGLPPLPDKFDDADASGVVERDAGGGGGASSGSDGGVDPERTPTERTRLLSA